MTLLKLIHKDKIRLEATDRTADSGMVTKIFVSNWTAPGVQIDHIDISLKEYCMGVHLTGEGWSKTDKGE